MPTPNDTVADGPPPGPDNSRPGRPQLACPDDVTTANTPSTAAVEAAVVNLPQAPSPAGDVATAPPPNSEPSSSPPIPASSSSGNRDAPCPATEQLRLDNEAAAKREDPWSPPAAASPATLAATSTPSTMKDAQSPAAGEQKATTGRRKRAGILQGKTATHVPYVASPRYDISNRRIPSSYTSSYLRPGRVFVGKQTSDRSEYEVQVELKHVDMAEAFLCGYLRIQGLTEDHPTLTTYFEGEMIDGARYAFQTRRPEWGSSEKNDFKHWKMFEAPFESIYPQAKRPGFVLKDFHRRDNIFMRWKEHFLVPDHRLKQINGASFEGFYYIMFNQYLGTVNGYYYHAKSERGQELSLRAVEDRSFESFEFR